MSEKPATTRDEMVEAIQGYCSMFGAPVQRLLDLARRLPSPAACAVAHGATEAMYQAAKEWRDRSGIKSTAGHYVGAYHAMERARVAAKGDDDAEG